MMAQGCLVSDRVHVLSIMLHVRIVQNRMVLANGITGQA